MGMMIPELKRIVCTSHISCSLFLLA